MTAQTEHDVNAAPAEEHGHAEVYEKDIDAPMILIVGMIFAVVIFLAIFFLQGYFYRAQQQEEQAKVISERPLELIEAQTAQEQKLHSYAWVDRAKGVVSLPIEVAMQRELERLQQLQRSAGTPQPAGEMPASTQARENLQPAAVKDTGVQN